MRRALLVILIVFICGVMALAVVDVAHGGISPLDVIAILLALFFAITIGGALTYREPDDHDE